MLSYWRQWTVSICGQQCFIQQTYTEDGHIETSKIEHWPTGWHRTHFFRIVASALQSHFQLLTVFFPAIISGTTHLHMRFPQRSHSMPSDKATPKRFWRWQQWNRHGSARSRFVPIAGQHIAALQETLQSDDATGHEQGSIGRCKWICADCWLNTIHISFSSFLADNNEAFQNDTHQREGNFDIFHLHGQITFEQIGPEEWARKWRHLKIDQTFPTPTQQ